MSEEPQSLKAAVEELVEGIANQGHFHENELVLCFIVANFCGSRQNSRTIA
jgi:hypothetical protein